MRNRIKDSYRRKGFCEQRIKQQEAERETTANDKKEEYKKRKRKEGFMLGGGGLHSSGPNTVMKLKEPAQVC